MTPYVLSVLLDATQTDTQAAMEQAVLDAYAHYGSLQKTANAFRVCQQHIKPSLIKHNVPLNSKGGPNNRTGKGGRTPRLITYDGRTMNCAEWARFLGKKPQTLHQQLFVLGWPLSRALG